MTKTKKGLLLRTAVSELIPGVRVVLKFWFCTTSMNNLGLYIPPADDVKRRHSTSIPYSTKRLYISHQIRNPQKV